MDNCVNVVVYQQSKHESFSRIPNEGQDIGAYSSDELIIFSAPWVIISSNSSLLAAARLWSISLPFHEMLFEKQTNFWLAEFSLAE
jgi:hypothetical protein